MTRTRTPSRASSEEFIRVCAAQGPSDVRHQSLTHLLPSQVDELLSADRRKDEFLATLCHELRSPRGVIQNVVGALAGPAGQDRAVQQRLHALIERQVGHMAQLTADLLDISAIAAANCGSGPSESICARSCIRRWKLWTQNCGGAVIDS
jgi:signal transduction histidine kinase